MKAVDQPPGPMVSIVVPNYNHAPYLKKRLDSIFAQTYQDFEVILLDDASTDESRKILRSYSGDERVRTELNETNSGSTFRQWNKGARLARGKYLWFAESDDYASEELLAQLVSRMEADSRIVLCQCRSWRVSAEGKLSGYLDSYLSGLDSKRWTSDFLAEGKEECRRFMVRCNTVLSASSVLLRRDLYWQVGGADESLVLCGDWKMWAGLALTGGCISYVSAPLNYYRFHDASVTERTARNGVLANESLQVIRWILRYVKIDKTVRHMLSKELSEVWVPAVLDRRVSAELRWKILRSAMAIDFRMFARLFGPGLATLRMAVAHRYRLLRRDS